MIFGVSLTVLCISDGERQSQLHCFSVIPCFFVCDLPPFASRILGENEYTDEVEGLNGLNTVLQQNSLKFTIFAIYVKIWFERKKHFPKSCISVTHVCYVYKPCEQCYKHGLNLRRREMPALFAFWDQFEAHFSLNYSK